MKRITLRLLLSALAILLAGCGTPGVPLPPSLELPKPVNDLRAARKGDKVYLAWTVPTRTTDGQTVRYLGPTRICRSLNATLTDCVTPVGESPAPQRSSDKTQAKPTKVEAKVQASYTDTLPQEAQPANPTGQITYAVAVLNQDGRSAGLSNQARVPAAPTLPPPADFKSLLTGDGALLTWTGVPREEPPQMRHVYRLYRRQEDSSSGTMIGEVPLDTAQFTDHGFEWEKTYYYRATTVTLVSPDAKPEIQVEGDDTPAVKVFAHDVFPPAVPSGLQAVFSGVGQAAFVDLIWAPDTDADLAGYSIYRHEAGGQPVKINAELAKTPAFRDTNVASGKKYFYSVSAVDLRGNESALSEETDEQVP